MLWAQLTYLILCMISFGLFIGRWGEERKSTAGWPGLIGFIIGMLMLYFAGAFDQIL
jgi:cytochrome c oxidase assembly factor CtaG